MSTYSSTPNPEQGDEIQPAAGAHAPLHIGDIFTSSFVQNLQIGTADDCEEATISMPDDGGELGIDDGADDELWLSVQLYGASLPLTLTP